MHFELKSASGDSNFAYIFSNTSPIFFTICKLHPPDVGIEAPSYNGLRLRDQRLWDIEKLFVSVKSCHFYLVLGMTNLRLFYCGLVFILGEPSAYRTSVWCILFLYVLVTCRCRESLILIVHLQNFCYYFSVYFSTINVICIHASCSLVWL